MLKKQINVLDLFSGMGGFSKGFTDAGFIIDNHYYSEVDKHAIANFKYNFKNSIYAGPVEFIRGASLPQMDIITFGSPCQDFSVAGQRQGLDGKQSSLIAQAIRIITEKKPAFFVWENVKGAFSSNNSEDFWAIIQAFANIGGYNIEWQCVNTLWLLPQNRERIYLVGHLTTPGRNFKPIFPITKNDRLFTQSKTTKRLQSQAEYSSTLTGGLRGTDTYIEYPKSIGTITAGANSGGLHSSMTVINAEYYSDKQQDRVYSPDGAMGCIGSKGFENKTKIKLTDDDNKEVFRRLTEIENERLQGFPDNWTLKGIYLKSAKVNKYIYKREFLTPTAKGLLMHHANNNFKTVEKNIKPTNRFKLIGNAVTKNFPEIIALKLIENYNL